MTPDSFDPWALLKNAWVAIAGLAMWVFKRHVEDDQRRADALAHVQQTYATRDQMESLTKTVNDNHQEILRILLERK